jgi:hypothetical protein
MKIQTLHTYQSVRFNKRDETHFTAEKPNMAGLVIEWDPKALAMRLSLPGAKSVLVFATNIAYAELADSEDKSFSLKK